MNIYEIRPGFSLYCDTPTEKYRCETFWSKEPETLEWINGFKTGGVFYDIGANIGIYSLFIATFNKHISVYAFEPMIYNCLRLKQNISLNQADNVTAFNIALGVATLPEKLYIPTIETGSSGCQLYYPLDDKGNKFAPCFVDDIVAFTLDDFIKIMYLPVPNYIKIDVDGHECSIINGMTHTLNDSKLQTLLIEFNGGDSLRWDFIKDLKSYGFILDEKLNNLENHSRFRRAKEGITAENMIFVRK